jgi:lipopolysaccharide transport system permease protein
MQTQDKNITIIKPKAGLLELNLIEVWRYRDLIRMLFVRDFVTFYKQTILGPIWFIIQPLFTAGMYTLIFGRLANISTDGIPQVLFYMAGIVNWGYFSECLTKTADTFAANAAIFGKVYFPRLTIPVTTIITGLVRYAIQFGVFLIFYVVFLFRGAILSPNWMIFLTPLIILYISLVSTGYGLWISSVTTKYRDLRFALPFGVQLWMYATPVVYPLSLVPKEYRIFMSLNPINPAIELFRKAYLGTGTIEPYYAGLSVLLTLLILFTGIIMFNKTEKTFMDTI